MSRLSEKVAIVTVASKGIGAGIATADEFDAKPRLQSSRRLRRCYALLTDLRCYHHIPQNAFLRGPQSSQEASSGLARRTSAPRRNNGLEERFCALSDRSLPRRNRSARS
jgi:hypothetical protein